jgi:hypothetical protein
MYSVISGNMIFGKHTRKGNYSALPKNVDSERVFVPLKLANPDACDRVSLPLKLTLR